MTLESILIDPSQAREVEPGLWSVLDEGDVGAPYDNRAAAYDRAVSNPSYLRIAWGLTRHDNQRFIDDAFRSRRDGWIADIAAGTCVDSAATYADTRRPTVVLDRSLDMLRRGRERLVEHAESVPSNVVFLQADAYALPFRCDAISTVLCHGAYHVFHETEQLTREWQSALAPDGQVFVSSLVRGRWIGDRYLGLLRRTGEIAPPRTAEEFRQRAESELGRPLDLEAVGNFAYARTSPA